MRSADVRLGDTCPFAVTVMDETGIDMSAHKPKAIADLCDLSSDLIVTLAPEAQRTALELLRDYYALMLSTGKPADPTLSTGNRD